MDYYDVRKFGINISSKRQNKKRCKLHKISCSKYQEIEMVIEGRKIDDILAEYDGKVYPCGRCLKNNKEAKEKCKKHNKK